MGDLIAVALTVLVMLPTLFGFLFMFFYMGINFVLGLLVPFNKVLKNSYDKFLKVENMEIHDLQHSLDFQLSNDYTESFQNQNSLQKALLDKQNLIDRHLGAS